jgi:hypothetical protein
LPNVVIRDCDGHTLSQTAGASVDLVHAQKVFVYLEVYATAGYLGEVARVVRPGGTVALDIVTEACLDDETVREWARRGSIYRPVPRAWAIEFLQRRGLTLRGSHFAPLPDGTTGLTTEAARLPPQRRSHHPVSQRPTRIGVFERQPGSRLWCARLPPPAATGPPPGRCLRQQPQFEHGLVAGCRAAPPLRADRSPPEQRSQLNGIAVGGLRLALTTAGRRRVALRGQRPRFMAC